MIGGVEREHPLGQAGRELAAPLGLRCRGEGQAAQRHARAAHGQEGAATYPGELFCPIIHGCDSSLAIFVEAYSVYAITAAPCQAAAGDAPRAEPLTPEKGRTTFFRATLTALVAPAPIAMRSTARSAGLEQ